VKKDFSNILKIGKEIMLESKKYGVPVGEHEKIVEVYEKAVMEKEKNDETEQFILNIIDTWVSCKACGEHLNGTICENCGFDNKEHKEDAMMQGIQKLSEYKNLYGLIKNCFGFSGATTTFGRH